MPLLKKIGNAVEDFASFAVPAGITIGANALVPGVGLAGALTKGSLLSALGAGAKGFAGNEQEERARKMQLQQNRNQSTANLINTLSPRANFQARQATTPSPGFLEQLAQGTGMGVDAFQTAQMLQQAAERAAAEKGLIEAQTGYYKGRTGALKDVAGAKEATVSGPSPQEWLGSVTETARYNPEGIGGLSVPMRVDENRGGGSRFVGMTSESLGDVAANIKAGRTPGDLTQVETAFNKGTALRGEDDLKRQKDEAALTPDPEDPTANYGFEDSLRDDFEQRAGDYIEARDGFLKLKSAAEQDSGPGDIAVVFGLMKVLDPRSTVREGEAATVEQSSGVPERIRNLYNRLVNGERLSEEQRQSIVATAEGLYAEQAQAYNELADIYTGIAERRGLNPENIITGGVFPESVQGGDAPGGDNLDLNLNEFGGPESDETSLLEERGGRVRGGAGTTPNPTTDLLSMLGIADAQFGSNRGPNQRRNMSLPTLASRSRMGRVPL